MRDKVLPILQDEGVTYTELHPKNPFIYDMLHRPVISKQKGAHNGYGWCGGVCRWGTTWKTQTIDKYIGDSVELHYIGIAADEQKSLPDWKGQNSRFLPKWEWTNKVALNIVASAVFCGKKMLWIYTKFLTAFRVSVAAIRI